MSVLYIDEQGAIVRKEGGHLVVERRGEQKVSVPTANLEQVIIVGNVMLTTGAISLLIAKAVDTVFLSYYGRYVGRLQGDLAANASLRRQQYRVSCDDAFCLEAARRFARGKLVNSRALLMRYHRKTAQSELLQAINTISHAIDNVEAATTLDELRGFEGAAAHAYFGAFSSIIKPDLSFTKRTRRPPTDPVNALLSLAYALLFPIVSSAVHIIGLDPYLGFFHAEKYGKPSLVLDIMEEFRPAIADSVVLTTINSGIIKPSDFRKTEECVYLSDPARAKFFKAFRKRTSTKILHPSESERTTYSRCVELQVRHLARVIKGDEPAYRPFTIR